MFDVCSRETSTLTLIGSVFMNQTNHNHVSIMSPHIQNFIYTKENEP